MSEELRAVREGYRATARGAAERSEGVSARGAMADLALD